MPTGEIVKPTLGDAERLQGFPKGWTRPAEAVVKRGMRWKLVGNAVTVPVAKWIGERLAKPGSFEIWNVRDIPEGTPWPTCAWNVGRGRFTADVSKWPKHYKRKSLKGFLTEDPELLSLRAASGFLERTRRAKLRFPTGFIGAIERHVKRMGRSARRVSS